MSGNGKIVQVNTSFHLNPNKMGRKKERHVSFNILQQKSFQRNHLTFQNKAAFFTFLKLNLLWASGIALKLVCVHLLKELFQLPKEIKLHLSFMKALCLAKMLNITQVISTPPSFIVLQMNIFLSPNWSFLQKQPSPLEFNRRKSMYFSYSHHLI